MRLKTIYSGLILAAMLVLASCNAVDTAVKTRNSNTPVAPTTTHVSDAPRITTAELDKLIKEGKVYIVDVRSQDSYDMGHIPGSHLIPSNEVYKNIDKLPRDKMIVTYCSWAKEHTSAGAVDTLKENGITNAAALLGGFQTWQHEGRPVDKKKG